MMLLSVFSLSLNETGLTQLYAVNFVDQQHYLWLIPLLVMSLLALVTFPLARHIVESIKLITQGMHKLTQDDYHQSIELNRQYIS